MIDWEWQRMRILNRRNYSTLPEGAIPVSRGTPFGNPFLIGRDGDRKEVIDKYRIWFHRRLKNEQFKKDVIKLLGHDLVCWCAPLPCHAQVIVDWLRSREESVARLTCIRKQKAKGAIRVP